MTLRRNRPLRRDPSKALKRTRLKPMSARRAGEVDERRGVREAVIHRDRSCRAIERGVPGACGGPLDVHEILPRSADASGYLDPANCILLCRRHHEWVGANPSAAHDVGLHRYSWEGRANI